MSALADRLEMMLSVIKNSQNVLPDYLKTTTHNDLINASEFLGESMLLFVDDEESTRLAMRLFLTSLNVRFIDELEFFLETFYDDENATDDQKDLLREIAQEWLEDKSDFDPETLYQEVEDHIETLRK